MTTRTDPSSAPTSMHDDQVAAPSAPSPATVVEVDARPLLARGEEPFAVIMAAAARVPAGGTLRLRAPFEPAPLYAVLAKRGFHHVARQHAPDDWEVLFTHGDAGAAPPAASPHADEAPRGHAASPHADEAPRGHAAAAVADAVLRIDVSDLVPPEPMVRILEAAAQLAAGQTLLVEHVRRPVYLYPQLEAKGFVHETEEPEPGRVLLRIRRRAEGE